MGSKKDKAFLAGFVFFLLLVISAPYIYAWLMAGNGFQFSGFLFNPLDGNSYLAKMYQGYAGHWRFTLPYTAEPGEGVYLFEFYLALGHMSRALGFPLIVTFHLARIIGSLVLIVCLYKFMNRMVRNKKDARRAFILASVGLGMGWLALPFGEFTSDFWVAEGYPILSMLSNPHFSFGLAMMLVIFSWFDEKHDVKTRIEVAILVFLLSVIDPFGVVIVWMVLAGMLATSFAVSLWKNKTVGEINFEQIGYLLITVAAGAPVLVYDIWISHVHPQLAAWNIQNLTPAPPVWDIFLSFSPYFPLLIWLLLLLYREKRSIPKAQWLPFVWVAGSLVLLYLPLNLQRRFVTGLYVPFVAASFVLLATIEEISTDNKKRIFKLISVLSIPTLLILLVIVIFGISKKNPVIFISSAENAGFTWIEENTLEDALILASPETGLLIPAHTGRRVLYGHPFETANAQSQIADVTAFFTGQVKCSAFMSQHKIDYVFWGPRELRKYPFVRPCRSEEIFSQQDVTIFKVEH